jgi:hypothetical protein
MPGQFCVSLTHAKNDTDKATVAFVIANAALGSDKDTMVFLSTEGVRLAVVTAPNIAAVEQRVRDVCDAAGVELSNIDVIPPDPADPERRVSVTVETEFEVIPGRILGAFSGTIPLRTTTIMRHEGL